MDSRVGGWVRLVRLRRPDGGSVAKEGLDGKLRLWRSRGCSTLRAPMFLEVRHPRAIQRPRAPACV
jgi:hypothetical protein